MEDYIEVKTPIVNPSKAMATASEANEKRNKSKEDEPVVLRLRHINEEGRKCVEKAEVKTHNPETIKHIERKLYHKGIQRMERHPVDGLPLVRGPHKSGHGGKYTWEGPDDVAENELESAPAAIDENDPNYVDEEKEERIVKGEEEDVAGLVVGEVEVAKAAEDREGLGVARVEVAPGNPTSAAGEGDLPSTQA